MEAIPLAGTEGASNPSFLPDGQSLGFYADGALRKVPVGGGPVVELCKTDLVLGASWRSKDQIVFANLRGGLWQVPAAGGTPAAVTKLQSDAGEISHRLPRVLPDGETVLFTVTSAGFPSWDDTLVVAQSLTTGTRKVLVEGAADARFVSTGHLVYLRKGTLMAMPFDLRRLEVTGAAVGVVSDVMQAANIQPSRIDTGAEQFAVSSTGSLVYTTGGVFPQDRWSIVSVDRTGRSEALRVPPGMWHAPRISPDGRRIAFGSNMTGDRDVWTYDVQRGAVARVPMQGDQDIPVWTPDGSRVAFSSSVERSGYGSLLLIDPDGRSPAERLTAPSVTGFPGSWTADGRELAFTAARLSSQGGNLARSIWVASRDGKTEPRQLFSDSTEPDFSADGRWLACLGGSPGQIYVQPYPAFDHRVQVSIDGGSEPVWRRDGRELYYLLMLRRFEQVLLDLALKRVSRSCDERMKPPPQEPQHVRPENRYVGNASENIGRSLGQVANRLDKLHTQRDAITAEIHRLAHSAGEMLAKVRAGAETEVAVVKAAVQRGRKVGSKMSEAARKKMSIAAKKRHATAKKGVVTKG